MWVSTDNRITFESFNEYRIKCGLKPYIARHIKDFVSLMIKEYPSLDYVSERHIENILVKVNVTDKSRSSFISCVREYLRYLNIIGIPAFVLDDSYSIAPPVYNPYLLDYDELNKLFDAIDTCSYVRSSMPYIEYILPVFYRMMYCCGMRPQEVVHLKIKDIDINTGEIYIRKTKSYKDRHIYVSNDLNHILKIYYDKVASRNTEYFFERDGKPVRISAMNYMFKIILKGIGLDNRIRQYDLRHAFITNTITEWIENGESVEALIPYLSEYVGHNDFDSTYYYLHLIPKNIIANSGIRWDQFTALYPRLEDDEHEN